MLHLVLAGNTNKMQYGNFNSFFSKSTDVHLKPAATIGLKLRFWIATQDQ